MAQFAPAKITTIQLNETLQLLKDNKLTKVETLGGTFLARAGLELRKRVLELIARTFCLATAGHGPQQREVRKF